MVLHDFFSTDTAGFRFFQIDGKLITTCFPYSFSRVPSDKSSRQFLEFDPCMPSIYVTECMEEVTYIYHINTSDMLVNRKQSIHSAKLSLKCLLDDGC